MVPLAPSPSRARTAWCKPCQGYHVTDPDDCKRDQKMPPPAAGGAATLPSPTAPVAAAGEGEKPASKPTAEEKKPSTLEPNGSDCLVLDAFTMRQAGLPPAPSAGDLGIYAHLGHLDEFKHNLAPHNDVLEAFSKLGNTKGFNYVIPFVYFCSRPTILTSDDRLRELAQESIANRRRYHAEAYNPPVLEGNRPIPFRHMQGRLESLGKLATAIYYDNPASVKAAQQIHRYSILKAIRHIYEYLSTLLTADLTRTYQAGNNNPRFRHYLPLLTWIAMHCRFFGCTTQKHIQYGLSAWTLYLSTIRQACYFTL